VIEHRTLGPPHPRSITYPTHPALIITDTTIRSELMVLAAF